MDVNLIPVKEAEETDLDAVVGLLQLVFGFERNWKAELEWQYLQNPSGRAIYSNAYDETGALVGHYAVIPTSPFADNRFAGLKTYLSLNTAVHPQAQGKGLFKRTARAVYDHLTALGSHVVLGIANENSVHGFITSLGFHLMGQLKLEACLPGTAPVVETPRLLNPSAAEIRWRLSRPGARYRRNSRGQVVATRHYHSLPVHCILSGELGMEAAEVPETSILARCTRPSIYATYGPTTRFAWVVPETLRPSPFHLICRPVIEDSVLPLLNHIQTRRFEFLDFDVV